MTTKITKDCTTSHRSIQAESSALEFNLSIRTEDGETSAELLIGRTLALELVTPESLRDWSQTLLTLAAKMEEK